MVGVLVGRRTRIKERVAQHVPVLRLMLPNEEANGGSRGGECECMRPGGCEAAKGGRKKTRPKARSTMATDLLSLQRKETTLLLVICLFP